MPAGLDQTQKRKWQNRVTKAVSCFLLEPRCRGKEASSGRHESSILETTARFKSTPSPFGARMWSGTMPRAIDLQQ
jgi:hypothetical protein